MSEFASQSALFEWARLKPVLAQYPSLDLLEGSLNGVRLTKAQAGKAKAAGMLKGAHDVRLPVARGPYLGLSVELKFSRNTPTEEQLWYAERLRQEGWRIEFAWEWTTARDIIIDYLRQPANGSFCGHIGSIAKPK